MNDVCEDRVLDRFVRQARLLLIDENALCRFSNDRDASTSRDEPLLPTPQSLFPSTFSGYVGCPGCSSPLS